MSGYEQELAALLALESFESDERAGDELRSGAYPAPPPGLRARMLRQALAVRPAGQVVDGVVPCGPAEAFARTAREFSALLSALTVGEWDASAHSEHGRVRDLVAHLIGIERLSCRWLRGDAEVPDLPDHVASTREVVAELGRADPAELLHGWQQAVAEVALAAADGAPDRVVTFHDLTMSVDGYLVTRTFELWAHAMDIALATDRPMPVLDDERMALMSSRLMGIVPDALAYRGRVASGRTARFVLTGAAGGCYTVPLAPGEAIGRPDVTIIASPLDVCRVAARRLRPDELDAAVEGDRRLAELVLAGIDAFARD